MKKIAFYSILLFLISSCTHRIVRTGYQINKSEYKNCDIIIKKFMTITDSLQKVGEIKLGESGFAVACSEAHALKILKNEGCALNANIVNIIEENRPDLWSSCYRCRASFYKFKGSGIKSQKDEYYKSDEVKKRVTNDRIRNTFIGIGAAVIGFIIGFYMFR